MWWPFQWVVIYILGGLTFVPLVVVAIIGYAMTYGSTPVGDSDPAKIKKAALQAQQEREEMNEKAKNAAATAKPLSGWLTVRRQFLPANATSSIFAPNMAPPLSTLGAGANPMGPEEDRSEKDDESIKSGMTAQTASTTAAAVPTTYSARIAQTYRQMVEARQRKEAPPKEFLFAMLKGTVLFLYEDEAASECVAAIGVNKYVISVESKEGGRFEGKDAEMFAKRNGIVMRIQEKEKDAREGLPALTKSMGAGGSDGITEDERESESAPWFLFSKSNTKTEDWYLALTAVSAVAPTTNEVFSERDMQVLVDTIDTEPDPIPMRWLNAFVGRIFFGLYRTEALEQFIIGRIMKKLTKVPRPSFLGPIIIREVNVGTSSPILSKPMLKELTADGTASFEVHLNYQSRPNQPNSEIRITIATTATIPTGFKPYVVDLVLAVVIKSFEGNVLMHIKRPPSNRLWYGFTQPPKMEIEIQPVVSERKIQIGMVLKAVEKQLREVIAEAIVLPNMDDIAFFDTSGLEIRGGIFSSAGKVSKGPTADVPAGGTEPSTQPGVDIVSVAEGLPTSALEAPAIRQRLPTKAKTVDAGILGGPIVADAAQEESTIPRNETAPALPALGQTARPAPIPKPTNKWFAGTGRPPSITSLAAAAGFNPSGGSHDKPRSNSVNSMDRGKIEKPHLIGGHPEAISGVTEPTIPDDQSPDLLPAVVKPKKEGVSLHDIATRSISEHPGSTAVGLDEHGAPISPASSTASTASLITALRSRDKKAVQSQVNTARDAVKKWGVNWAAKTRTNINAFTEDDPARPVPVYRPPDEDDVSGSTLSDTRSRSPEAPKSLQDRLSAAAAAAAATRPKSSSVSSTSPIQVTNLRPTLQPSPGSNATMSALGTSPPQWTLSNAGPTVGIARDVAAKPTIPSPPKPNQEALSRSLSNPKASHDRRASVSTPVLTQPSAGRSMVVPRVPKRPGEVVGMGSSQAGFTRRISDGTEGERYSDSPSQQNGGSEAEKRESAANAPTPASSSRSDSPAGVEPNSDGLLRQHAAENGKSRSEVDTMAAVVGRASGTNDPGSEPSITLSEQAAVSSKSVPQVEVRPSSVDGDDDDDRPLSNVKSTLVAVPSAGKVDSNSDVSVLSKQAVRGSPRRSMDSMRSRSNNASAEDLLRHLVSREQDRERSERPGEE